MTITFSKVKEEKTLSVSKNSLPKEETKPASLSLHPPNPEGFGVNTDIQDVNAEDYYRRMVQENPCNPLVLSNYARFLHQVKFVYPTHLFCRLVHLLNIFMTA